MTIKEVQEALKTATKPVARSLHHNAAFRVMVLGLQKGMEMTSHTAKWPSKLTILEGAVIYMEGEQRRLLNQYDELNIPVGIPHSLEATEYSLCLLTQSDEA